MDGYWRALNGVQDETRLSASAAQVARAMGVSRNTARKYLSCLVKTGQAVDTQVELRNGVTATYYSVVTHHGAQYCQHAHTEVTEASTGEIFWYCLDCGEGNG